MPARAFWGLRTKRAVENFLITGVPVGHFPELQREAMTGPSRSRSQQDQRAVAKQS